MENNKTQTKDHQAQEYAEDTCPIGDYCGGVYDEQRNSDLPICIDDAKSVLTWLFAKPLAQRLTPEEKEQIRFAHKAAKTFAERTNPMSAEVFKGQYLLLESIFGADFFKEEE